MNSTQQCYTTKQRENATKELASLKFIKGSKAAVFRFVLLTGFKNVPQAKWKGKPYMWSVFFTDVTKSGNACYYLAYDGAVFDVGSKVNTSIQHYYATKELPSFYDLIQGGYGIGEEVHVPVESITEKKDIYYWSELVRLILIEKYRNDSANQWLSIPLESITTPLQIDQPEAQTIDQWNENRINFLESNFKDSLICF